ncbi:MAG: hypothetical protein DME97_03800 [Verrucomicrobia bacterium]|nr:MAG: hypothetical protein DME97_03800 [Verrucomicrobiota bacterium]
MPISRAFRANIRAGIVSGLLLLLIIQPLLGSAWGLILRYGGALLAGLIDSQYYNASLGKRDWVPALFALWLMMVCASFGLSLVGLRLLPEEWTRRWAENRRRQRLAHPLRGRIRGVVLGSALTLGAMVIAGGILLDLQLNTSFDQRLNVITPAVPDQTVKELRAAWANMRSREDYLRINTQLEQLAKDHSVALPQPLPMAR